jgi:hypothetical protein
MRLYDITFVMVRLMFVRQLDLWPLVKEFYIDHDLRYHLR